MRSSTDALMVRCPTPALTSANDTPSAAVQGPSAQQVLCSGTFIGRASLAHIRAGVYALGDRESLRVATICIVRSLPNALITFNQYDDFILKTEGPTGLDVEWEQGCATKDGVLHKMEAERAEAEAVESGQSSRAGDVGS